ncbi:MAG: YfhO family protein, partial [Actinobacteria bacterium]|nr:YfhO family protein [Actinomycetota bacterium]
RRMAQRVAMDAPERVRSIVAVTPVPAPNRNGVMVGLAVLVASLAATALIVWLARQQRPWAICLVAPIVAIEALVLVLPYWHRSPDELVYPPSPLVSRAVELEGHDRVEGIAAVGRGATSWYRLRTATGYSPAPEEWADLLTLVIPTMPRTQWTTEIATVDQAVQQSALLDRLGVRYLIVGAPTITGPLPAEWTPIVESPGGVLVERSTALSRIRWASTSVVEPDRGARLALLSAGVDPSAVVLDEPSEAAEGGTGRIESIDEADSDVRRISVHADGPGYLVVADSFDPWWTVTIDGREVPLLRADHAMMAVAVPAGDHRVELRYTLPTLPVVLSVVAVVLVAAIAVADIAVARRRRGRART